MIAEDYCSHLKSDGKDEINEATVICKFASGVARLKTTEPIIISMYTRCGMVHLMPLFLTSLKATDTDDELICNSYFATSSVDTFQLLARQRLHPVLTL